MDNLEGDSQESRIEWAKVIQLIIFLMATTGVIAIIIYALFFY